MNWIALVIWAWLAYALEAALGPLWQLGGIAPSPLLVLLAWVALRSRSASVFWPSLLLGLLADLQPGANAGAAVVGPHAVGYVTAAWAISKVRSMVFRDGLAPLAAAAGGATVVVGVIVMAILQIRQVPWITGDTTMVHPLRSQLGRWLLTAIYTAALAVPLGWLLKRVRERWRP